MPIPTDGVNDNLDAFPLDDSETVDTDGTERATTPTPMTITTLSSIPLRQLLEPIHCSLDTDADGVNDNLDAFPLDDAETLDTDGDGTRQQRPTLMMTATASTTALTLSPSTQQKALIPIATASAITPTPMTITTLYSIPTKSPPAPIHSIQTRMTMPSMTTSMRFPLDATETLDTDGDGAGNNADTDDDGDGVSDGGDASHSTQQKPLTLITMESEIMRTLTMMAMV